ncbi:MAG TPA: fluoride efflux transporter CrcB [Gammaproteobacteria bacterium]|nr:fluoride efflux transporter CrcB [Gammaproteobacteria bacterium]
MIWNFVAVAIGGAVGCCARYGLTHLIQSLAGREWPVATFAINVTGSFLLGFLFYWSLERTAISPAVRVAVLTGGLGGFTTFSTYMLESVVLVRNGAPAAAVLYVLLSVVAGFLAAFAGAWLAQS